MILRIKKLWKFIMSNNSDITGTKTYIAIILLVLILLASEIDLAGHHWLTPVILATQEAKIRRIEV
jgi:hypothetical protein